MLWPPTAPFRAMNLHDSRCEGAASMAEGLCAAAPDTPVSLTMA